MSDAEALGGQVAALVSDQEKRKAIYFPLRLDETLALARELENSLSSMTDQMLYWRGKALEQAKLVARYEGWTEPK